MRPIRDFERQAQTAVRLMSFAVFRRRKEIAILSGPARQDLRVDATGR